MRNFLSVADLSPSEITSVIDRAGALKLGAPSDALAGKVGVMIFEKPSLRTKLSFDIGIGRLGGRAIYFSPDETGMDVREPTEDIARVVSRMGDFVVIRTFNHSLIERFSEAASIPVINALTDGEHPCQALADLQTIKEAMGGYTGFKVAYVGDGNNVAASLALAMASVGGSLTIGSPEGYELPEDVLAQARSIGAAHGATIEQVVSPEEAVSGASIVYTDVWASMGQESESSVRKKDFTGYQVNPQLLENADPEVKIMHDLPAHPGEEISVGLLDDSRSIVFDQAENRLHAQMGLMDFLLSDRSDR
ncbi:MAG: ornithine carbamoyltransferase [Chloroflexi bacterium]|nr:ornithine carbamoyltransferase [Chloroflexota bacterium]